jgi:membrane-associated phospholipid phosphatase
MSKGSPASSAVARTPFLLWPWLLGLMAAGVLASLCPPVIHQVLILDEHAARFCNSLLNHNPAFDRFVGALNTKRGDATVFLGLVLFCAIHSCFRANRAEVARRTAFWLWVAILFTVFYQFQKALEILFSRDSPSIALPGWIRHEYLYAHNVKVANSKCYPAGHAAAYFFLAFMALGRYRAVGFGLLALALVLPATRVVTGAHWPSDSILGSVPLMGVLAVLSYETRASRLHDLLRVFLDGAFRVIPDPAGRPLADRTRCAWREFTAPAGHDDVERRDAAPNNDGGTESGGRARSPETPRD